MLIDWFTVGAQVVNFLILVWLLKRFLYKPILDAIDSREKRIADQYNDAQTKTVAARKEQDDFRAKNKTFDEQRDAMFNKDKDDSKKACDALLQAATKQADDFRAAQALSLKQDQARLSDQISHLAAAEVIDIARKTLGDLATVTLESRVEEVFTLRIRQMQGDSKARMAEALKSSEQTVVRSCFDLSPMQQTSIKNAINETFSIDSHLRFEVSNALLCGIELTGNGQRLDWNISAYLSSLDRGVSALLGPGPTSESTSEASKIAQTDGKPKSEDRTNNEIHAGVS
jgi:F-type H+-transporting ATPase subunit b